MTQEALKLALEALENNKLNHLYCEDTWYSCPKHEDGCANEAEGDECNCGADEVNAQFDNAITAIKKALAQPEQEHFARLVAKAEREACAQTCENLPIPNQFSESEGSIWDVAALDCAEAIRARGEQA